MKHENILWIIAILFFGIGDLGTTFIGLHTIGIVESHPLFSGLQWSTMAGIKAAVMALFYLSYTHIHGPHRIGIPFGLSILGIAVTLWNSIIIITVVL